MRKSLASVVSIATLVAACGGFGSEEEEKKEGEQPPPSTPQQNSVPPVPGKPVNGIFVSSSKGRAGASGFVGSPLNTIKDGLARAKETKLQLIVCAEEYAENVEWIDGVSAYGYFDCSGATFVQAEGRRAVVKPSASPALAARDIRTQSRIEGFDFIGPDLSGATATERTGSSVAGELRRVAPNTMFFNDVSFHGGDAAHGANATATTAAPTPTGTFDGTIGIDQSSSNCTLALPECANMPVPGPTGPAPTCGTEAAPAPGGNGGDGMWFIENMPHPQTNNIQMGRPLETTPGVAIGGTPCGTPNIGANCGLGTNGSGGAVGSVGGSGKSLFDGEGFLQGAGKPGGTGKPGQSGGGGGGADLWFYTVGNYGNPPFGGTNYRSSARGGSGGAGGCGGIGGNGGAGGAASVGLIVFDAPVVLERVKVDSAKGGRGGDGGPGSAGSGGGTGAAGGAGAGRGGDGGPGGFGGPGGHGPSGPSVGLAYFGPNAIKGPNTETRGGPGGEPHPEATDAETGQTIPATPVGDSYAELEIVPPKK